MAFPAVQNETPRTLDKPIQTAVKQSVEEFEPRDALGSTVFSGDWFWVVLRHDDLLPSWGLRQRDLELRKFWYAVHNTLVQGAITNLIKRYVSTPWQIEGGRNLTRKYTQLLQDAEFGEGYSVFMSKVLLDYFTQDFGAVIEVMGPGDPNKPLIGPVTALNHLDSLRCVATGNLEFPVIYWSRRTGQMHRMHATRVIRLVDMPSSEERAYNNGLCALSRIISIANAQVLLGRHLNEKLSDLPPIGFLTLNNVKPGEWEQVMLQFEAGRRAEGQSVFRNVVRMESENPSEKIEAQFIPFSTLPDNFNYREYIEIHVNAIALGLGDDPQNIWPLTGAPLGTGTQSQVLHAKGESKTFGFLMRLFERTWNIDVLPPELEFTHKYEDRVSDSDEANTAKLWVDLANAAPMPQKLKLQLIANKVSAFADVLLDEEGNIRLPDVDPKVEEQEDVTIQQDAATPGTEDGNVQTDAQQPPTAPDVSGQRGQPEPNAVNRALREPSRPDADLDGQRHADPDVTAKALQATRLDFEADFADAIAAAQNDDMGRRRFGIVARALISKYGRAAYEDGLADGGVEDEPTDDDVNAMNNLIAEQSAYVTDFADRLFEDADVTAEARAEAWWNKSLYPFYLAGLASSDIDPMQEWVYGDTIKHCEDCSRLNGQRHRLSEWIDSGWLPKSDQLKCHGDFCDCSFVTVKGRARGSYYAILFEYSMDIFKAHITFPYSYYDISTFS